MTELATFIDTYSNQYKFVKKHYGGTNGDIIIKTLTSLKKVIDELNKLKVGEEETLLDKICNFYRTIEEYRDLDIDGTIVYIIDLIKGKIFDDKDIKLKHGTLHITDSPLENLLLKVIFIMVYYQI